MLSEADVHRALRLALSCLSSLCRTDPSLDRLLGDRLLPAWLFGAFATARGSEALTKAGEGPADLTFAAGLAYILDVAQGSLACLFCGLVAVLFLIRRARQGSGAGPVVMAVAVAGTFLMAGIAAHPVTTRDWRVLALADFILAAGLAFSIYAAASLRHCFALAAEARGLVTSGAYRLVRHPLYIGESVAALGALLPVLAPPTALIYGLFCVFQASRAVLEERVLAATFPEYADYRDRTPALLPWPARNRVLPDPS